MIYPDGNDPFQHDVSSTPGPEGIDTEWAKTHNANEEAGAPVTFSRILSRPEHGPTDPGDDIIEVGGKILSTLDVHDPDPK